MLLYEVMHWGCLAIKLPIYFFTPCGERNLHKLEMLPVYCIPLTRAMAPYFTSGRRSQEAWFIWVNNVELSHLPKLYYDDTIDYQSN